jgi:RNA polymerase sigma-70 factor (ECF subfamily)
VPGKSRGVTNPRNLNLSGEPPADYDALVRAAATGSRPAMERLLMRAQAVAFRFSLLVCGQPDDAEDVMQEALLKTYRYVSRIERPEAFRAWLFRTVRNACLIKRRRHVGEPSHVESLDAPPGRDGGDTRPSIDVADRAKRPDEAAINTWLGRRLRRALASLAPVDRMIVLLREMEGLSTREVAEVTHMSESNVKTRLHRARTRLRELLGDV